MGFNLAFKGLNDCFPSTLFFHQVLTGINEHNTPCAEPGATVSPVNHSGKLSLQLL